MTVFFKRGSFVFCVEFRDVSTVVDSIQLAMWAYLLLVTLGR